MDGYPAQPRFNRQGEHFFIRMRVKRKIDEAQATAIPHELMRRESPPFFLEQLMSHDVIANGPKHPKNSQTVHEWNPSATLHLTVASSVRLLCLWLVGYGPLLASPPSAYSQTVEGDILRAKGCYLRGLGWYNLNSARANSINVDATIRWKQDLRRIQQEMRDLEARKLAGKKLKTEELKQRRLARERQLRTNPSATDVQSGEALNAIVYDLSGPNITHHEWESKVVPLPTGVSIKDLVFRFIPQDKSSKSSAALSKGVIALARLDIDGRWPTVMQLSVLEQERIAYEQAYAAVHRQILEGNFDLNMVLAMDRALENLKRKVTESVPTDRGFRSEAQKFMGELELSTRLFDAETVDYAREMLIDTKDHDATTVAELLAFMLKYRLQFASAQRDPTARELYAKLYDSLRQQSQLLGITLPEELVHDSKIPTNAVEFKGNHYLVISESVSWHKAKQKCEDLGGHLVVINDAEENAFVTSIAAKASLDTIWLGATDEVKEGEWVWVTGQKVTYANWIPGQPNNWKGNEHYPEMIVTRNFAPWKNRPGQWNDLSNTTGPKGTGYICEWEQR